MIQTTIRISEELHEDLRSSAYAKKISINKEIILRLTGYAEIMKASDKLDNIDKIFPSDRS